MSNVQFEKMRIFLDRPGMFIGETSLDYAIAFVSGLNYGLEDRPLQEFHDWLLEHHFSRRESFAWRAFGWEDLVEKIPACDTGNARADVQAFLNIVREYLDTIDKSP